MTDNELRLSKVLGEVQAKLQTAEERIYYWRATAILLAFWFIVSLFM